MISSFVKTCLKRVGTKLCLSILESVLAYCTFLNAHFHWVVCAEFGLALSCWNDFPEKDVISARFLPNSAFIIDGALVNVQVTHAVCTNAPSIPWQMMAFELVTSLMVPYIIYDCKKDFKIWLVSCLHGKVETFICGCCEKDVYH